MMMPKRSMLKKKKGPSTTASKSSKSPELADFVEKRDYAGAVALLDFQRQAGDESDDTLKWLAYACVHSGDFRKALEVYETLERESSDPPEELPLWKACCHFYLGEYTEAESCAKEGSKCSLQNRILMHTAHKCNDESALMQFVHPMFWRPCIYACVHIRIDFVIFALMCHPQSTTKSCRFMTK